MYVSRYLMLIWCDPERTFAVIWRNKSTRHHLDIHIDRVCTGIHKPTDPDIRYVIGGDGYLDQWRT